MSLARYFVFARDDKWTVALDGTPHGRYSSRLEALNSAIVMADLMGAMQHDADVMVEEGGKLEIAWTFGVDPLPLAQDRAA